MSAGDRLWAAVPGFFKENDVRLIGGFLLFTYLVFALAQTFISQANNVSIVPSVSNALAGLTFLVAVYALMALALNLHWGYTGLFNIGIAGFMAVGVYSMAILAGPPDGAPPGLGLPVPLAVLGALLITAVVGGLTALPALQLDADYLAIVTVGLSEIIRLAFSASYFAGTVTNREASGYNVVEFLGIRFGTGGGQGINTPSSSPLRFIYRTDEGLTPLGEAIFPVADAVGIRSSVVVDGTYALFLLFVAVTAYYVLLVRVGNSPFGRVLKAIREDEIVAQSLGKDTRLFKVKVFMLGCALMGLGGILWQGSYGFVNPNTFRPILTFYIFAALIVGGAGSNTGSVIGGAVFAAFLFEGPKYLARIVGIVVEDVLTLLYGSGASLPSPNTSYEAFATLNPLSWLGFMINNVNTLKFVFLGAVLVYLMQNRPEGLMGDRKEIAASVDLSERGPSSVGTGGDSDE